MWNTECIHDGVMSFRADSFCFKLLLHNYCKHLRILNISYLGYAFNFQGLNPKYNVQVAMTIVCIVSYLVIECMVGQFAPEEVGNFILKQI